MIVAINTLSLTVRENFFCNQLASSGHSIEYAEKQGLSLSMALTGLSEEKSPSGATECFTESYCTEMDIIVISSFCSAPAVNSLTEASRRSTTALSFDVLPVPCESAHSSRRESP